MTDKMYCRAIAVARSALLLIPLFSFAPSPVLCAETSSSPSGPMAPGYWKMQLETFDGRTVIKIMLLDPKAESTEQGKPAFLAPPHGAKPYHGYPLILETCIDGYCYGAITDFLQPDDDFGCRIGDGFVQAPDGSRAGFLWEVRDELKYRVVVEPDPERWGVYYFAISDPIQSLDDLKTMFRTALPVLKHLHKKAKR